MKPADCFDEMPIAIESDDYATLVDNHVANAMRMGIMRFGNVVTTPQIAALLPHGFDKVRNWANGKQPKTQAKVLTAIALLGLDYEVSYDAVHGRRYQLLVYPRGADRVEYCLIRGAMIAKA